jgi:glycosyltransferase involved in cell wall biosynthesis
MPPTLTVIMPVYNEEEAIEAAVAEIREHILDKMPGSELLAVDDGSKDRSPALLDEMARALPALRVLHKPNGGHGDAVRYGLDRAEGEYLFLLDSDRQIPVEDFALLWEKRGAGRLVSGLRRSRHDPLHRLVLTRIVRAAVWVLFGKWVRDANVPFKLLHRQVWQRVAPLIARDALTPSLFLAVAAAVDPQIELATVVVRHRERTTGATVLRPLKLLRFCRKAFGQMLRFRKEIRRAAAARR